MVAELGLFCLIIALMFSILLMIIPSLGLRYQKMGGAAAASCYVWGQFIFVFLAYIALTVCFLRDDFTLNYVLANSSRTLPWFYKLCAVWGGHEGSMLLWVLVLTIWTLAVSLFSRTLGSPFRVRVLVVLGALSFGFLLFLLMTSNPFLRQFQLVTGDGRDLNPLLQDPGFLFHPPMLYMGYVGFAVAYAFAMAALWLGRVEAAWAKWTRPWTLAAWCALTLGITLGSWWAYRELGWGGWWFWDPVENASFMPWIVGTALLHSLAVNEQRQQFGAWTLLLAITAFSLSLIGTFLVRSGVLTSVHAFAVDPERGLYILLFLAVVIGGSLTLFAFRASSLVKREPPAWLSRDSALLLNNVFLVVIMLTILMGTLYPLLIDGLGLGKLSVGAPYFNAVFVPLMIPILLLMGFGVHLNWQHDRFKKLFSRLRLIALGSFLLPLLFLAWHNEMTIVVYLGLALSFWIILSTLHALFLRIKQRRSLSLSFIGMVLAHIGIAVTTIGITVSSAYGIENDVKMAPGQQTVLAGYVIAFLGEKSLQGPNYRGSQADFIIQGHTHIYPEKRIYDVGQMAMTESAIDVTLFRDIYIALGEPLGQKAWSVRLYYKPLVRWIWGGGIMMFLGGLLALLEKRYYVRRERS